ncbi:MAG: DNA recombination protein RmuC, partial [Balneolaceae bacterium]
MELFTLISGIVVLAVGAAAGFLFARAKYSVWEDRALSLRDQLAATEERVVLERRRADEAEKREIGLQADYRNMEIRIEEQKREFEELRARFQDQFENLANRILEEKSKKFTEQNREKLDQLLKPLGEKIEEFKKQVAESYDKETRDRVSLKEQIHRMAELNQQMTDEAKNLTRALKGDSKQQGNWGEVILQRILERSGLTRGREYEIQESMVTDEGRRLQPDVVVYLPEEKRLVIDSKVSLTAYERLCSSEDETMRDTAIRDHVQSVRTHVKQLSKKSYQHLHGGKSPDFVLLFVPVEPAFAAALQYDSGLYYEAFELNIVIVSPSTLLATLATIDTIWKQEYQNKNAQKIAERGGFLYDKFTNFTESLLEVGRHIEQTQKNYDRAMNQL